MNLKKFASIIAALCGAAFEYYDYMLFAIMLPVIAPLFTSGADARSILTSGYLIMFLGALMRPIGGIIIGYIGDKKGRSIALFWAMIIMAISCFSIGLLPTYAEIGGWAIVTLFICRMLQTMSAASELNGVAIYLIETIGTSRKGLASGLAWMFTVFGMLAASLASYLCDVTNWRMPFLIGGGIALFAIALRLLSGGHSSSSGKDKTDLSKYNFKRSAIASILLAAGLSGMFYYNMIWFVGHFQCEAADCLIVKWFGVCYFSLYALMLLLSGYVSDYLKRLYVMPLFASVLIFALAVPSMLIHNLYFHFVNVVILAFYVGPSHAVLFQLFPKEYRFRAVSITYSIGTSIIGGITPFVCNYFVGQYKLFPAIWLMFLSILAFLGVFLGRTVLKR